MADLPLLMIPGPIEVSPGVIEAYATPPPSHLSPSLLRDFGISLGLMRDVWLASAEFQPFLVAGSGTLAMEMAVLNVLEAGDCALLVNTGYFADRMEEILRRRGVLVDVVSAPPGQAPSLEEVDRSLKAGNFKALIAIHVDTSTGVRVDAKGLCGLARDVGALSIFDGVCATAGERFEMSAWGSDVYFTASQKAIGLPSGMALLMASPAAIKARRDLSSPPPISMDWMEWLPIMRAYEEGRASYFSTPATNLIGALRVSLEEQLAYEEGCEKGMSARFLAHERVGSGFRAAWKELGLSLLPAPELAANTLSAIRYPKGIDVSLVSSIRSRGVIVAGGLHPLVKDTYFRVGHMGVIVSRPEALVRTVEAIASALDECGFANDMGGAIAAAREVWE